MKRYAFLLMAAGLSAIVSVSRAQDQPPKEKPAVVVIENHHIMPPEDPAIFHTIKQPECRVMAFAETTKLATVPAPCVADADYGSCNTTGSIFNKNSTQTNFLVFKKPISHSSGGMPL